MDGYCIAKVLIQNCFISLYTVCMKQLKNTTSPEKQKQHLTIRHKNLKLKSIYFLMVYKTIKTNTVKLLLKKKKKIKFSEKYQIQVIYYQNIFPRTLKAKSLMRN